MDDPGRSPARIRCRKVLIDPPDPGDKGPGFVPRFLGYLCCQAGGGVHCVGRMGAIERLEADYWTVLYLVLLSRFNGFDVPLLPGQKLSRRLCVSVFWTDRTRDSAAL